MRSVIGETGFMPKTPLFRNFSFLLVSCMFALLLAFVWPASSAAQQTPPPGPPPVGQPTARPQPTGGPPGGEPTPRPTATPTSSSPVPTSPPGGNGDRPPPTLTPTPRSGSGTSTSTAEAKRKLEQALAEYELIKALAPNRIIFHAATPIQLIKVEDGLQVYYIGRDGKTRLGPWVPGFAELAAKHPEGTEASIYLGSNPLTGKRVKIDYLPHVNRIRVDTFYSDRENDKNKQYIFHFGPEHDIVYDAW